MLSQPEKSLRLKVWATICVTLAIVVAAVVWSNKSFNKLTESVDKLGQPNQKITLINNILREFVSAENDVQRYIISGDLKSARTYEKKVDQTREKIRELKAYVRKDSSQLARVVSLEAVVQKKLDQLNRFLTLKKERQATTFTQLALDKIEASAEDGDRPSSGQNNSTSEERTSEDELWSSLREWYGKTGTPYDTANWSGEDLLAYLADPKYLTSDTQFFKDTLLSRIRAILSQTGDMELQMQQRLTQREYQVLLQGKIFMDEIQSIIAELEASEQEFTSNSRNEVAAIITNSTRVIRFIGLGGLSIAVFLLVLISRDIVQASSLRRKLEASRLKAEALGKMKESFLANMSHEIRTPLNSILGFAGLMKRTQLSPHQQNYMKAVSSSSDYLMKLVNDILDHSKIESGKLELVSKAFAPHELAEEAKAMFLLMAEKKELNFDVTIQDDVPDSLRGDIFRIKQITNNLLSNAFRFTHNGTVSLTIGGSWFKEVFYLDLSVSDTGIGIEPDRLERIFESFRQEDASTSDYYGGTGLGLSICKQLSEAMGGSIQVVSRKGVGTTFTLKLPLQKPVSEIHNGPESSEKKQKHYKAKVVIVEDDPWNALLLETLLRKKVSEVIVFKNPLQAREYVKEHKDRIDLLFTDMKMPEMTGDELARACRETGYQAPIVLVTAHLSKNKEERLRELEIQAVCHKPYDELRIDELLEHFLDPMSTCVSSKLPDEIKNDNPLNIDGIKAFAGDDPELLEELLGELISNNEKQVELFGKLLAEKRWSEIADLAHKMSPSYDHTGMLHISESLKSIELYSELGNHKRIEELCIETKPILDICLQDFKKLMLQFHTA